MQTVQAVICLILFTCQCAIVNAAYCHGKPKPDAHPNTFPIYTKPPVFVRSVPNGKLFVLGEGNDTIKVVHVYGDPYTMGFAHGSLLQNELHTFTTQIWQFIDDEVKHGIPDWAKVLPDWMLTYLINFGIDALLDITYEATRFYTGSYIYEEMRGLADGSGVSLNMLIRIHMIGELTKGHCSMFGAWGEATKGGSTIQLRAFDWVVQGPFKDYPAIVVYHPNDYKGKKAYAFANLGFIGWIGSFSGVSENQMAISEIGVSYPDDTFGSESRIGIAFTFLLRDILQFDLTLDDSINRITTAKRTCSLILGVGDGKLNQFRSFQYSSSDANVIDDVNLIPKNDTWHAPIKNVVYHGMDWLCPPFSEALMIQLNKHWGNITAENAVRNIVPLASTGTLQVAVYDLTAMQLYLSYARKSNNTEGPEMAYDRPYVQVNLKMLFAEPKP